MTDVEKYATTLVHTGFNDRDEVVSAVLESRWHEVPREEPRRW